MVAKCADRVGMITLSKARAVFIADEGMMKVMGLAESEDGLELPMDVRGAEQVFAAGDVGDILKMIIHDHCEMVCDADVFTR